MKGPIMSLEVAYHVHATEDRGKVDSAVAGAITGGALPESEELEGHHGNRIDRLRVHLTGEDAQGAFERVVRGLGPSQRARVVRELRSLLDEHHALFLRFDKQRLVEGSLSLGSADPVRVKVKPRPFLMGGDDVRFYTRLISG